MANIRYVSSSNVSFNLLSFEDAKLETANFHKVSWGVESVKKQFGTTINRFTKQPQTFSVKFKFKGDPAKRKQQIDNLIFQTEKDIADMNPGRIYWNDQYISVYLIDHSTYPEDSGMNYTITEGKFYAPFPFWIEEKTIIIKPSEESSSEYPENVKAFPEWRDWVYPYDYAYPYARNIIYFDADSALPSDFRAAAYGPVLNYVNFFIDGHEYKVNYELRDGQVMFIDTRDFIPISERCYVLNENGTKTNVFDYRSPDSTLFEKIPAGNAQMNYSRAFRLDLTIFQERSAPI